MKCPLCSKDAVLNQTVEVADLKKIWGRLGLSIGSLFNVEVLKKYGCQNCGLGFYHPFVPGDDKFYSRLAEWDWYYAHSGKTEYGFTSQIIKPGMKVIDVGCGIGEFSSYIPAGANFTGAELSTKSVEIAQSLGRNVKRLDIIEALSDLEGKFDVVTCFQVLEHIVDLHQFFNALVKICKPDGKIVIAVPNNDGFVGDAKNNILNMPPHHLILWNEKSIRYLANYYGLSVEEYCEERVTSVHLRWFYTTRIHSFIKKLFGIKPKVINLGCTDKLTYKISSLIALPLSYVFRNPNKPGHSLIIVLHRPAI